MMRMWRRGAVAALDRTAGVLARGAAALGDGARTARFVRGLLTFDVRAEDVFVASYPRSGTTWTQLIVYYVLSGSDQPRFSHICDVCPWFERSLAHRSEARGELASMQSPRVFKTHLVPGWLPRGARYIYVRRRPEDVAVSYFHLYQRYLGFDQDFDAFFDRFVRGDLQYRSWASHVGAWEAEREVRSVLFLKYEDMLADPNDAIENIAAHLGAAIDPSRAAEIARLTAFSSMKAQEDKYDHIGELCRQWGIRDGNFLRAGSVGGGAELVTDAQREQLQQAVSATVQTRLEWRLPAFLH